MTSLLTVVIWGQSDNCYQFKTFALLLYSRGVSPRIPSNLMMSQHPHGICLHILILISQSAISSPFRPHPHGLHKPQDMPCFLHSDSDQQKDNIKGTQPLASSACNINSTQPLASSMCCHLYSRLVYIFLQCTLTRRYRTAYSCNNFSYFLSDDGT